MTEQFRFQERIRQRHAIHRNEGTVRPQTGVVNRARNEFFSRAAFPIDQHVGMRGPTFSIRLKTDSMAGLSPITRDKPARFPARRS